MNKQTEESIQEFLDFVDEAFSDDVRKSVHQDIENAIESTPDSLDEKDPTSLEVYFGEVLRSAFAIELQAATLPLTSD